MKIKKILIFISVFASTFFLAGCSLVPGNNSTKGTVNTSFIKSSDSGKNWESKVKIDDKKTIAAASVLSMALHPDDSQVVYIGTEKNGLFVSKDGAETWQSIAFAQKVYGLSFDSSDHEIIYASGVHNDRGKLFKRQGEQGEWKEIYTEPSDGTYITALGVHKTNGKIVYAGTSDGVIIKSVDGGDSWRNIKKVDAPVVSISFDAASSEHVYFGIFKRGILETKDGGSSLVDITSEFSSFSEDSSQVVYSVVADPWIAGAVFVGTEKGIIRGVRSGEKWDSLNVIASSKEFPIRAIAVNPKDSKEIIYSAGGVIYKTVDGGTQWSTFQLDANKGVGMIRYDQNNPANIYIGLRKL